MTKTLARPGVRLLVAVSTVFVPFALDAQPLVPPQPDLTGIVKDADWALILGKALFWEERVGSDDTYGQPGVACASCHFSAGADSRLVNQLSPGLKVAGGEDHEFGSITDYDGEPIAGAVAGQMGSGASRPDGSYALQPEDFPLHKLFDGHDRNSEILRTTNDVVSSNGSHDRDFRDSRLSFAGFPERCSRADSSVFSVAGRAGRMVEPRNTPTTINAAFNFKNFWDGRANHEFNGQTGFGPRDANAYILRSQGPSRLAELERISIADASLASQAVVPVLSNLEMSCDGRTFADVGRKLLYWPYPLAGQEIDPNDSVFGSNGPEGDQISRYGNGLDMPYWVLVQRAFDDSLWNARGRYSIGPNGTLYRDGRGYSQIELNFPLFFGVAVMMYESTLISDQSAFDDCDPTTPPFGADPTQFVSTCRDQDTLNDSALRGWVAFNTFFFRPPGPGGPPIQGASCFTCHPAPLFTEAQHEAGEEFIPVERSNMADQRPGMHDRGFFNIGVRPTSFDRGSAGLDPWGNSLSDARMFLDEVAGKPVADPTGVVATCANASTGGVGIIEGGTPGFPGCNPDGSGAPIIDPDNERHLVEGTFKTPTLRNVALNPPYFHYGGYKDLEGVMEFYIRGGSHRDKSNIDDEYTGDTSGTGPDGKDLPGEVEGPDFGSNVDRFINPLVGQFAAEDMVEFMRSLTDPRVQCDAAPFDHPELHVSVGQRDADRNRDGMADDIVATIPAVGAGGYAAKGMPDLCLPNTGDFFDPNLRNRLVVD